MDHMNISPTGVTVLDWIFTATGLAFTIGRYVIRYRDQKRLYWDDLMHFLAVLCGLGSIISLQLVLAVGTELQGDGFEGGPPSPSLLVEFLRLQSAQSVLFFSCIYSIKGAFLLFYRQLFVSNETFVRIWWLVSIFTVAAYITSVVGSITLCGPASQLGNLVACTTPQAVSNENRLIYYSMILNVLTDITIMVLPIYMLRSIQIPLRQKIGLGIIFSLATIIIMFEILRFLEFLPATDSGGSLTMPVLWSVLETNVALVVSCLPVYRTLLRNEKKQRAERARVENVSDNAQQPYTNTWNVMRGVPKGGSQSTVRTNDAPEFTGDLSLPTVLRGPGNDFV